MHSPFAAEAIASRYQPPKEVQQVIDRLNQPGKALLYNGVPHPYPVREQVRKTLGYEGNDSSHVLNHVLDGDDWAKHMSIYSLEQILDEPIHVVVAELAKWLRPYYSLVQPQLDYNARHKEFGFNNHELDDHVLFVVWDVINQLKEAGFSLRVIIYYLLPALLHDLTNLEKRTIHGLRVPGLTFKLLADVENMEQAHWLTEMLSPAALHEEEQFVAYLLENTEDVTSVEEFFAKLPEIVSPGLAALIIADKRDIHPVRMKNTKRRTVESLKTDKHFMVNAFTTGTKTKYQEEGGVFKLDVPYNQMASDNFVHQHPDLVIASKYGYKKAVKEVLNPVSDTQKYYFEQWQSEIEKIYHSRFMIAAISAFRLYNVKEVEINFYDEAPKPGLDQNRLKKTVRLTPERVFNWLQQERKAHAHAA